MYQGQGIYHFLVFFDKTKYLMQWLNYFKVLLKDVSHGAGQFI